MNNFAQWRQNLIRHYLQFVESHTQTQVDTTTQLEILIAVANKLGLYDAADYLVRVLDKNSKKD